ncbi:MAG TPA: ABC transporter ATP-binding protein [Nitrososphaerales archaeon]|nr:ABC transporter ATP-binding protein [Nitrososphaerales archaeon]
MSLNRKLLAISDLSIDYQSGQGKALAVQNASLDIGENQFVAVVGESGCGKSTLALAIIGLLSVPPAKIESGKIVYKSVDLLSLKESDRRKFRGTEIAMIFQEPLTSLNPVYKVGDQIAEAIMIREQRNEHLESVGEIGVMQKTYSSNDLATPPKLHLPRFSSRDRTPAILAALKLVRIADPEQVIERYPFELSGGMRQRVMIAMALSQKPALLLADEPTTALDVTTQAQVLKLMKTLMSEVNTSILLITHDLAVASQVADRIIVMYAGDLVEDSDVYDLFSEPLHPYTKGLLSCIPSGSKKDKALKPIPGSVFDLTKLSAGCKFAPRCSRCMDICRVKKPVLVETKPGHRVACFLYGE